MKNILNLNSFPKLIISNLILLIIPLFTALPWQILCFKMPNAEHEELVTLFEKTYPFLVSNHLTLLLTSIALLLFSLILNFLACYKSNSLMGLKISLIILNFLCLFLHLLDLQMYDFTK